MLLELVPELELHPDDYLVTKQRVGAFIGTSLDETLRQRGVTQVLVAGICNERRRGSNGAQRPAFTATMSSCSWMR
jgi:isochorismate hydrolase